MPPGNRQQKISRTAGLLTFALFLAILLVDFADQSMLGPLVNPLLLDFFGRTSNVVPLGWVSFAFMILSALSMMTAGFFADRESRKTICFAGCLASGTFSVLTILTPHGGAGYVFFFITRALNGVGIGAIVPAVFSMVGDSVDFRKRSTAFGTISVAVLMGRLAGFVVAGSLASLWRMGYLAVGTANLVLAVGLLLIREPQRGSREAELQGLVLEGAEYRFKITRRDIRTIWANRSNFWLIANFIDVFPGAIITFLIFKYMKDIHNMNASSVNFIILLVFAAGAAGALVFGRLGDWGFQKDRRAKVLIALFCNGFPIVFMAFFLRADFRIPVGAGLAETLAVPGVWPLIVTVAAAVFINQGVNPNWYSCLTDTNLPEHRATIIALASVMDMLGNALGPLWASYIATAWGMKTAMGSVLIFWGLNVFLWLPVLKYIRGDLQSIHGELQKRALEMRGKGTGLRPGKAHENRWQKP